MFRFFRIFNRIFTNAKINTPVRCDSFLSIDTGLPFRCSFRDDFDDIIDLYLDDDVQSIYSVIVA